MQALLELGYFAIHLYCILRCWLYPLCVLFAYKFLYSFLSPRNKAYLDHERKIANFEREISFLLTRLWRLFLLLVPPLTRSSGSSGALSTPPLSRLRNVRKDTPFAAFLRIIHMVHYLHTSGDHSLVNGELRYFSHRGITGAFKPDHFLFGGEWHIKDLPDPRDELQNDPLLCAIAASTAEQMVEAFNWRIGLGIRRDLCLLRTRKPYWDKNLAPCVMETAPEWCKGVGPAPVRTVVDRKCREDTAMDMLELDFNGVANLSSCFKYRNLLANSRFLYFA